MKRVIVESPFAGDRRKNTQYAWDCIKDSLDLGESPFASHLFYPMVLNEDLKEERLKGIVCGYQWMAAADLVAFYVDLGMSPGMQAALDRAKTLEKPFEMRKLYDD